MIELMSFTFSCLFVFELIKIVVVDLGPNK